MNVSFDDKLHYIIKGPISNKKPLDNRKDNLLRQFNKAIALADNFSKKTGEDNEK